MSYIVTRPFISPVDRALDSDPQEPLVYLFAPAAIVDLPLAVALDTLFLPYDIHRFHNKESDYESWLYRKSELSVSAGAEEELESSL